MKSGILKIENITRKIVGIYELTFQLITSIDNSIEVYSELIRMLVLLQGWNCGYMIQTQPESPKEVV